MPTTTTTNDRTTGSDLPIHLNRRVFLRRSAMGVGTIALGMLAAQDGRHEVLAGAPAAGAGAAPAAGGAKAAKGLPGTLTPLHHAAKAKRVIWLSMAGGPSHLETWDHKPKLGAMHGQPMPESITKGKQIAQLQGQKLVCFGPQTKFARFGKSGTEICDLFPLIGSVADDICFVRSMTSEAINHDPAHMFMNTGSQIAGRPSMGSWVLYGLGCETSDLPGFVVLNSNGRGGQNQPIAARQWSSGFLPGVTQGVQLRGRGDPVLYLNNPPGVTRGRQEDVVNAVNSLNAGFDARVRDPEIATRIAQYEMAFRMQAGVPALMDFGAEPKSVLDLYGCKPGDGSFAGNCLLARRLAERGVRFIQLYHRDWDHHGGVKNGVTLKAQEIDRACMALITDLRSRDLLKDTIIVWAGEFGRTPMSQGGDGRDHHNAGFTIWMAGGGIKGGLSYGATDEFGYAAEKDPVTIHDVHATMLHLLGVDHMRFSVKFQGLDAKLTGVEPCKVIKEMLA